MNRFFTLLLAASCLTATSQVPDYVPTEGLVAWYALDGDAADVGPDQLDGLNVGAIAAQNRYGQASAAMYFDGQSVIELPSVNFPNGLTVSLWVKEDQVTGVRGFLSKYDGDNGASGNTIERTFNLYRHNEGRGLKYYMAASSTGTAYTDVPSAVVGTTEWVHLVAMFGGETLQLFVNGEFDSSHSSGFTGSYFQSNVPLIVGGSYPIVDDANKLRGVLDDLGIWNRALTIEEIQGLYDAPQPSEGCTDVEACNYEESAILDDGSCLDCALFAERCGPGTLWDSETQMCIGDGSADINLDGCVQLNDLLDLLSAYGDCGAEESVWQCGDPLEYQSYDYATVEIGEQCWFAENLRSINYLNGEPILTGLDNEEWESTSSGALAVNQNEDGTLITDFGLLYNHFSVLDERGMCPHGWHVPFDDEFIEMEIFLGLPVEEIEFIGWRGSNQGDLVKASTTDAPSWNGTNESGFSALAGGYRRNYGTYQEPNACCGYWWTADAENAIDRALSTNESRIQRKMVDPHNGLSIRCIKDTEQ